MFVNLMFENSMPACRSLGAGRKIENFKLKIDFSRFVSYPHGRLHWRFVMI